MVIGQEKIVEYLGDYADSFVVIGGAACDLLLSQEAGLSFRATKDIDMVLTAVMLKPEFAASFRRLIDDGGYKARQRADSKQELYRFTNPADISFPHMIELFAPEGEGVGLAGEYTRLDVEDDLLSLSAILLNKNYSDIMLHNRTVVKGIPILTVDALILFKIRAAVDLSEKKQNGEKVKSVDVKKHQNDVFRLLQVIDPDRKLKIPPPVKSDVDRYCAEIQEKENFDPRSFSVNLTREEGINYLMGKFIS